MFILELEDRMISSKKASRLAKDIDQDSIVVQMCHSLYSVAWKGKKGGPTALAWSLSSCPLHLIVFPTHTLLTTNTAQVNCLAAEEDHPQLPREDNNGQPFRPATRTKTSVARSQNDPG